MTVQEVRFLSPAGSQTTNGKKCSPALAKSATEIFSQNLWFLSLPNWERNSHGIFALLECRNHLLSSLFTYISWYSVFLMPPWGSLATELFMLHSGVLCVLWLPNWRKGSVFLNSLLELLCLKCLKLEPVVCSSPSSHFWMWHWDTSTNNMEGHFRKTIRALCRFHSLMGRTGGWLRPAHLGVTWGTVTASKVAPFLPMEVSFSHLEEGIPDLPGGTKSVILKTRCLDQRHRHHLGTC